MNWIGLVKLNVGLDLFGLDWMNWIGLMFGIWYLDWYLDVFDLVFCLDWIGIQIGFVFVWMLDILD